MVRFLQACLAILILSAATAVLGVGWYGCYAIQEWGQTGASASELLATMNRPCENGKPCGTLADVARTLNTIRGTFGQIEVAARHENRQLSILDAQERQLFEDLHGTSVQARETLSSLSSTAQALTGTASEAQHTIERAQPLLESLNGTAKASTDAIDALNARISDTHVDALMRNLDQTSDHVSGITGNLEKMSGHIEKEVDAPSTWKSRAAGGGMDAAKLLIWWLTR